MAFNAKILKDSISSRGVRITTLEVTFPRIVLSEFNTHRMFSRNSASSRAIPVEKMLAKAIDDPYIPTHWGKNQKGMSAFELLPEADQQRSVDEWVKARDNAIQSVKNLKDIGVHKQITNRLLEPFMWHTVIVTATDWSNYFSLRIAKDAHPDICTISEMMKDVMSSSVPELLSAKQWHLPLIRKEEFSEFDLNTLVKISTGRCARVSYLTHDGVRDPAADIKLHDDLLKAGHMSPFEHQARPMGIIDRCKSVFSGGYSGNLRGWVQYRKTIKGECR